MDLTTGKLLERNAAWNLIGESSPLIIAVIAIPRLVYGLGTQRFGILLLAWALIGYLSLFDLGVGRALTSLVAQRLGAGGEDSLPPLIWTAILIMSGVGILGGLVLAATSTWLTSSVLKIPNVLQRETLVSLYMLSVALPAVISTTGFRGILEAYQRFGAANAIRIPMGAFSFGAPLIAVSFSRSLIPVVAILALGRFVALIAHIVCCRALLPVMRSPIQWQSNELRPLLSFGGWMTVSNVIAPVMAGMDRMLLGIIISVQAVAYYATPYEVVTKLLIIPAAISGVLFPAFASTLIADPQRSQRMYKTATRRMAAIIGPIVVVVIVSAHFGLRLWLGEDFANQSTHVTQILAVGILFNSIAYMPFALVQGSGRSRWTGKLHIAELPAYLILFWIMTHNFGIVGTAVAWSVRSAADAVVLLVMADRILKNTVLSQIARLDT